MISKKIYFIVILFFTFIVGCFSHYQPQSFLNLPFEADWRKSSFKCLEMHNKNVQGMSFLYAVEDLINIKLCIKAQGKLPTKFDLVSTLECKGIKKESLSDSEVLKFCNKEGVFTSKCFKWDQSKCTINECEENQVYLNEIGSLTSQGIIMQEILFNGPVLATFQLYSDFLNYNSGLYIHESGELIGTYSVLLVGYKHELGESYWIGKTNLGSDWGEGGYFKIQWNQVGISDNVLFFTLKIK